MQVRVGPFLPSPPEDVSGLMFEMLDWWNKDAPGLSPVLSSAIVHHRFETIHPFADGNGRTGRALALWEFYRRGSIRITSSPWTSSTGRTALDSTRRWTRYGAKATT